ncbi:hypothetical protein U8607_02200 [Methylobacterium durans]|uniref:hypothetical protein n=1 Tax=Methylobacterium durans TaxID=2202825 RepID=UPI002AFF7DBA|nr:hypothetical protein [Methylobacterium durans]MEA1830883.1 hypothetical protein [Methylobacterium durans]
MKVVIGIALVLALLGTIPSLSQARRALLCEEEVAIGLAQADPAHAVKPEPVPSRTFSLILNREMLNLIFAGRTEFYECQEVYYRGEGRRRTNTIKCQNATNFFTLDLSRFKFAKSQLNPEDPTDIKFSYGTCKTL